MCIWPMITFKLVQTNEIKTLLYLFVFTAVILVFQLVNSAKVVNFQAETLEMKNDRIEELKNELQAARAAYADDVHFSLDQNLEAQRYFPSSTPGEIIQRVKDKIYDSNAVKGENPWFHTREMGENSSSTKSKYLTINGPLQIFQMAQIGGNFGCVMKWRKTIFD